MKKILTVTIPAYNVERYIRQCLDSFAAVQKKELLEVLVVDDGSTDETSNIAREYQEKFPDTFRIIQKENGGHGSTINRGIKEATGSYFKVVDSDDWVDDKAFDKLLGILTTSQSDLVYANYYWVEDRTGKKSIEFPKPFERVEYRKEYLFKDISDKIFLKMHGFTVKTEILRQIPAIDEHCFYVDMEFVLFPIPMIETIIFIPEFIYMYRIGLPGQSMSPEKLKRNAGNYDRVLNRLLLFYGEQQKNKIENQQLVYIEHTLARMVASRIKIFLCQPYSKDVKEQLKSLDLNIQKNYPKVYNAVSNRAVRWLRKSNYHLYSTARMIYYWKERLKKNE